MALSVYNSPSSFPDKKRTLVRKGLMASKVTLHFGRLKKILQRKFLPKSKFLRVYNSFLPLTGN